MKEFSNLTKDAHFYEENNYCKTLVTKRIQENTGLWVMWRFSQIDRQFHSLSHYPYRFGRRLWIWVWIDWFINLYGIANGRKRNILFLNDMNKISWLGFAVINNYSFSSNEGNVILFLGYTTQSVKQIGSEIVCVCVSVCVIIRNTKYGPMFKKWISKEKSTIHSKYTRTLYHNKHSLKFQMKNIHECKSHQNCHRK